MLDVPLPAGEGREETLGWAARVAFFLGLDVRVVKKRHGVLGRREYLRFTGEPVQLARLEVNLGQGAYLS